MNQTYENLDFSLPPAKCGLDNLKITQTSASEKECRICLQEIDESIQSAIAPCKCSGSIAYVHFSCMGHWIKRNHPTPLREMRKRQFFRCEMCKTQIGVTIQKQIYCVSKSDFEKCLKKQKQLFFVLIGLLILFVPLFILGLYILLSGHNSEVDAGKWFIYTIIVISLIVIKVIIILSIYLLIKKYFTIAKVSIIKIGDENKMQIRSRTQSNASQMNLMTEDGQKRRLAQVIPLVVEEFIE